MPRIGRPLVVLAIVGTTMLAAAGISSGAESLDPTDPRRYWDVDEFLADGSLIPLISDSQAQGIVSVKYGLGLLDRAFDPLGKDGIATAEVFSNASGRTWWLSTESQAMAAGRLGPEGGSYLDFAQFQGFKVVGPDPSLRLIFTKAFIDVLDHNGGLLSSECVEAGTADEELCGSAMWGEIDIKIEAWADPGYVWVETGSLYMEGYGGRWRMTPNIEFAHRSELFWTERDFEFVEDVDGDGGLHARVGLRSRVVVDIPIDELYLAPFVDEDDDPFSVRISASIETWNRRGRESWMAAYIRDPAETDGAAAGGATIEVSGLVAAEPDLEPPDPISPSPVPCSEPDPSAGILRLDTPEPRALEMHGARWQVVVSREDGSRGDVGATLRASDESAKAGSDYEPLDVNVTFADGDATSQSIYLPVVTDTEVEPDETLSLTLSDPGGCATLGTQSSTVLTLLDDDAPVAPPTRFTVGGTVSGLIGTGLVLQDQYGLFLEVFENGPFTFVDIPSPAGTGYAVSVFNQPRNPSQTCTVANGTGTFIDHSVTNVEVTCVGT